MRIVGSLEITVRLQDNERDRLINVNADSEPVYALRYL